LSRRAIPVRKQTLRADTPPVKATEASAARSAAPPPLEPQPAGRRYSATQVALIVIATIASIAAAHVAEPFLVPLVMGILLSYTLRPLVSLLELAHLPRFPAAALVVALLIALISATAYTLRDDVNDWVAELPSAARKLRYAVADSERQSPGPMSHMKAAAAWKEGKFKDEVVPIKVNEIYVDENMKKKTREYIVDKDEGIRADTTVEGLSKLKPVFAVGGTVTAGNSSQTSDGAAFVAVMSEKMVKQLNLKPIARMMSYATAGVDPRIMGIGPVAAIPKALKIAGKKLDDIDLIELNEAFAAQSLAVIKELTIDRKKLNPNGGAIAVGHPLGSSGARLSVQLFNELRRQGKKYGMVTACVGGGQGVAGIYELLN